MTQPNEMILIGVNGEPSRMFSTTSGDSMYNLDETFRKMTLIKPSKRVNIRKIFAPRAHRNITMELWSMAKSIDALAELKENMLAIASRSTGSVESITLCPNCGYFTINANHPHSGNICAMCGKVAVKYSKR